VFGLAAAALRNIGQVVIAFRDLQEGGTGLCSVACAALARASSALARLMAAASLLGGMNLCIGAA
jgi:hypothetical protein